MSQNGSEAAGCLGEILDTGSQVVGAVGLAIRGADGAREDVRPKHDRHEVEVALNPSSGKQTIAGSEE